MYLAVIEWPWGADLVVYTHDSVPALMRTVAEYLRRAASNEGRLAPELDLDDPRSVAGWLHWSNDQDEWAYVTIFLAGAAGERAKWVPHVDVPDGKYLPAY